MLEPKEPNDPLPGSEKWPITELVHAGGFTMLPEKGPVEESHKPTGVVLTVNIEQSIETFGDEQLNAIREAIARAIPNCAGLSVTLTRQG
jgi:hypothetical protein